MGIDNINVFNLAIGGENKKDVSFSSDGKNHSCLVENGISPTNTTQQSTVNKIKFTELFTNPVFKIDKIKYLKMDIETAEFEVFKNIFDFFEGLDLLEFFEYLHIELHPPDCEKAIELKKKLVDKFGEKVYFDT